MDDPKHFISISYNCQDRKEIILKLPYFWRTHIFLKESLTHLEEEKIFFYKEFKSLISDLKSFEKIQKILLASEGELFKAKYQKDFLNLIPDNVSNFYACCFDKKKSEWKDFLLMNCMFFIRKTKNLFEFYINEDSRNISIISDFLLEKLSTNSHQYEDLHLFLENNENSKTKMPKLILPQILQSKETLKHLSIYFIATYYFEKGSHWKSFCEELEKLIEFEQLEDLTLCFENNEKTANFVLVSFSFLLKFLFLYQKKVSKLAFYYKSLKLNFVSLECFSDNLEYIFPKLRELSICFDLDYSQFYKFQFDQILSCFMENITKNLKRFTFALRDKFFAGGSVFFDEKSMEIILYGIKKTQFIEFNLFLHTKPKISCKYWKKFLLEVAGQQKILLFSTFNFNVDEKGKKMLKIYSENIKKRNRCLYLSYTLKKYIKNIYGRVDPLCEILNYM